MPDGSPSDLTRMSPQQREQTMTEQKQETEELDLYKSTNVSTRSRLYEWLAYVPPWCRYDPKQPFKFSMGLNFLFGTHSLARIHHFRKDIAHSRPSLVQPLQDASPWRICITVIPSSTSSPATSASPSIGPPTSPRWPRQAMLADYSFSVRWVIS